MDRVRRRVVGAALAALFSPGVALSQAPGRVYRVAWIGLNRSPPRAPGMPLPPLEAVYDVYRARIAELSFTEGHNLELRTFMPKSPSGPDIEEAVRQAAAWNPDVIKVRTVVGTLAARKAAPNTPIVFSMVPDPVASGIVPDLVHPGGNVTGIVVYYAELNVKTLELVREMLPHARTVAVIFDSRAEKRRSRVLDELQRAGARLGLGLDEVDVATSRNGLAGALDRIGRSRPGAVLSVGFVYDANEDELLLAFQSRARIPVVSAMGSEQVARGVVASVYEEVDDLFRRAADVTVQILRGAKPADIPIAGPLRVKLLVNAGSARAIGLSIPRSVLARADKVIE